MSINRTTFFAYARKAPFGGRLSTAQVQGVEALLDACVLYAVIDLRWIAYILATAFHETGGTMQPVREAFGKSDADTIARLDKAWAAGKMKQVTKPYWRDGWFGRGFVQLTFLANYVKMGARLGLDLVKNPSLMLEIVPAAKACVVGMYEGMFTGKKLSDYFSQFVNDAIEARRIVNGKDKAKLIATYHKAFLDALEAADTATPQPVDVKKEDAKPDDVPPAESKSLWTILTTFLTGTTALPFLGNINNGWALGAFGLILLAALVGGYLVLSGRVTINRTKAISP